MKIFHLLVFLSGVPLLCLLVYNVGLSALWQEFMLLGWALLPLILLEGAANLFHAQGLRYCLPGSPRSLSFGRVFCVLMAGSSINYLTPTAGLGGEVTKGVLLASDRAGAQAATVVLLDKLSRALAQLIFVVFGCCVFLSSFAMPRVLWFSLVPATALLGSGIIGFLAVQRYGKLGVVVRWAVRHRLGGAGLRKTADSMTEVDVELRHFYRTRPKALFLSIWWHFAGLLWGVVPTFSFLYMTGNPAFLSTAGALAVLGSWFDLVAFAIPTDIGVQEATRVLAFRLVGFPSALGLTYGIARRLQQLFWAAVGLMLYGLLLANNRTRPFARPSRTEPGEGAYEGLSACAAVEAVPREPGGGQTNT